MAFWYYLLKLDETREKSRRSTTHCMFFTCQICGRLPDVQPNRHKTTTRVTRSETRECPWMMGHGGQALRLISALPSRLARHVPLCLLQFVQGHARLSPSTTVQAYRSAPIAAGAIKLRLPETNEAPAILRTSRAHKLQTTFFFLTRALIACAFGANTALTPSTKIVISFRVWKCSFMLAAAANKSQAYNALHSFPVSLLPLLSLCPGPGT